LWSRMHHAEASFHFAGASEGNPGDPLEHFLGMLSRIEIADILSTTETGTIAV